MVKFAKTGQPAVPISTHFKQSRRGHVIRLRADLRVPIPRSFRLPESQVALIRKLNRLALCKKRISPATLTDMSWGDYVW